MKKWQAILGMLLLSSVSAFAEECSPNTIKGAGGKCLPPCPLGIDPSDFPGGCQPLAMPPSFSPMPTPPLPITVWCAVGEGCYPTQQACVQKSPSGCHEVIY